MARANPDPWKLDPLELARLRHEVAVTVVSNYPDVTVRVDGQDRGRTPVQLRLMFQRPSAAHDWNEFVVTAEKEGYRRAREPGESLGEAPPFSRTLTLEDALALNGQLTAQLEPLVYVRSPILRIVVSGQGLQLERSFQLSQTIEIETEPRVGRVTRITDEEGGLFDTRIAVTRDRRIIYTQAAQPIKADMVMGARLLGTPLNLRIRHGAAHGPLTKGLQVDLEACLGPDERDPSTDRWVYFAADRLGTLPNGNQRLNLWRIDLNNPGGLQRITDSPNAVADTEPAVSPDGKRISYTSLLINATNPHIWIADANGANPMQVAIGKQSCWSPDGKRLCYVAPDGNGQDKIWIMNADGTNPKQVTEGKHKDLHPVWTYDGRIVYASNQGVREGEVNSDIWIIDPDGGDPPTQLTVNGSYDSRPAVGPAPTRADERQAIYFLSNRGAQRVLQENTQIWMMELPPK